MFLGPKASSFSRAGRFGLLVFKASLCDSSTLPGARRGAAHGPSERRGGRATRRTDGLRRSPLRLRTKALPAPPAPLLSPMERARRDWPRAAISPVPLAQGEAGTSENHQQESRGDLPSLISFSSQPVRVHSHPGLCSRRPFPGTTFGTWHLRSPSSSPERALRSSEVGSGRWNPPGSLPRPRPDPTRPRPTPNQAPPRPLSQTLSGAELLKNARGLEFQGCWSAQCSPAFVPQFPRLLHGDSNACPGDNTRLFSTRASALPPGWGVRAGASHGAVSRGVPYRLDDG